LLDNSSLTAKLKPNDLLSRFRAWDYLFRIWDNKSGTKTEAQESDSRASIKRTAGLHVVQRAATPAREPAPVAVDIISRAIIPAGVEQMPVATACFTRVIPFFRPATALFIRLRAGFFVSHIFPPFVSLGCCLPAT
jgi:hypothetical protein